MGINLYLYKMEKDLFEIIVKSLTKCDEKTKQVMDIVYPYPLINYTPLNRCSCGKRFLPELVSCPYCTSKIEDFIKCNSGHFYGKDKSCCPYCLEDKEKTNVPVIPTTQNNKKKELMDSLNYLKNKCSKSKQDRDSIYTLEVVLKNM